MRTPFYLVAIAVAFAGCASRPATGSISVSDLPTILSERYKVDPYIRAAVALQSLDRSTALAQLHLKPNTRRAVSDGRVIILCRMLFAQRQGSDFRRPMIGGAGFFGGTDYSDWPLEPIELVDGVPFLITRGYVLGGLPEADEWYLHYCETNCDWSNSHYAIKTDQQKREALYKLLASPKWKRPLDTSEREFLSEQIQ